MSTQNSTNNLVSAGSTLVVTTPGGPPNIETQPVLQTDTGFNTWTGAGAYFDDTTLGSFTVSRGGTGYIKGVPVTWAGGQTVTGMNAGDTYLIYMDDTGTIGKTTTFSQDTFQDYIVLFECLRDSTPVTNNQLTVKENHPSDFPVASSYYLHETIGVAIENRNGGANITLNGTQGIQINGSDELADHGLYTTIPDSAAAAVLFYKYYTDGAGKWARQNYTDTFTGYWNNAGTATALGANKHGVYTLYVSKDNLTSTTPVYVAVLDTSQYNNLASADTAIANGTVAMATSELAKLEIARLGYIIYAEGSSSIVQVIIDKETVASGSTTSGTNIAALVLTSTTNFDGILTSADANVQAALDTIDDYGKWVDATGATQAITTRLKYVANRATVVAFTLPVTAAFGDTIEIVGYGAGGWTLAQNAGQSINSISVSTTVGVGGSLASTNRYDAVWLVCVLADTTWTVKSSAGNITIA